VPSSGACSAIGSFVLVVVMVAIILVITLITDIYLMVSYTGNSKKLQISGTLAAMRVDIHLTSILTREQCAFPA
jgi:hypothetical protein